MVQHRYLGDVDKHEPQGIDTAAAGEIYKADGAGSGSWGNAASAIPVVIVQEAEAYSADGNTATSGSWGTYEIGTETKNDLTGASLSSNVLTLPAGTYYVEWWCRFSNVDDCRSRLRDTTAGSTLAWGSTGHSPTGDLEFTSRGLAYFTLTVSSGIELQYRVETSNDDGLGGDFNFNSGDSAVDPTAQIVVWKAGA